MSEDRLALVAGWRKSSYSNGATQTCVEVGHLQRAIGVRDSTDASGPVLVFGLAGWSAFVAGVKAGQLPQ